MRIIIVGSFAFAIIVTLIFSCKKDKFHEESFSGIVLHAVTQQTLANQKVSFGVTTYSVGKKDPPEWPDGKPIFTSKRYLLTTDNSGRFTANFEVTGEWMFTAQLVTGQYIQKIPIRNMGFKFPGNAMVLTQVREMFDTIYAEKPTYIKYEIKNINDAHANDTIFVWTAYQNKWSKVNINYSPEYSDYNFGFAGPTINYSFLDTIPAESESQIPVKWVYKQADIIAQKSDIILVQPNTTIEYNIEY